MIEPFQSASRFSEDQIVEAEKAQPTDGERDLEGAEAFDGDAGALAKVRELLFGEQVRDTDKRFQELQRKTAEALEEINREALERIETLGRDLHAKLDALAGRLTAHEAATQEQQRQHTERLTEVREELTERISQDTNALSERMGQDHAAMVAHVDRSVENLEQSKMDRRALAALLSEMASRVDRS